MRNRDGLDATVLGRIDAVVERAAGLGGPAGHALVGADIEALGLQRGAAWMVASDPDLMHAGAALAVLTPLPPKVSTSDNVARPSAATRTLGCRGAPGGTFSRRCRNIGMFAPRGIGGMCGLAPRTVSTPDTGATFMPAHACRVRCHPDLTRGTLRKMVDEALPGCFQARAA